MVRDPSRRAVRVFGMLAWSFSPKPRASPWSAPWSANFIRRVDRGILKGLGGVASPWARPLGGPTRNEEAAARFRGGLSLDPH